MRPASSSIRGVHAHASGRRRDVDLDDDDDDDDDAPLQSSRRWHQRRRSKQTSHGMAGRVYRQVNEAGGTGGSQVGDGRGVGNRPTSRGEEGEGEVVVVMGGSVSVTRCVAARRSENKGMGWSRRPVAALLTIPSYQT